MIRKIIFILVIAVIAVPVTVVAVHVIAVGGIYAFSSLKARNLASVPNGQKTESAGDSVSFYTVKKGDTPAAIAKKLHVSCDELLEINKITEPGKLQVGQKLLIPAKKKSTAGTRDVRARQIHVS